jgi:hypothetical protein
VEETAAQERVGQFFFVMTTMGRSAAAMCSDVS